ncbi:MAG: DUF5036 family protein [Muribaculaceae bacterium]|nr:DUF5036 family protein [Muribaculaceae bacterium]
MKHIITPLLFIACLLVTSCSNDDEPTLPANAIPLNMMFGDSETTIGASDVYINSSINFTSSYCGIADLGKKGTFSTNPNLTQIAQEIAVTPGNYYQITPGQDILTVAGARALPVDGVYYNLYVDSWIYDNANNIAGAKISYAECSPRVKQLPAWDSAIDLQLKPRKDDPDIETAEYAFPRDCKIDDYIETYDYEGSDMKHVLDIDLNGNRISFTNSAWTPGGKVQVILLVRCESVYTRLSLILHSSM